MKKAMFVILVVLVAVGFAMAQTYTLGSGITGADKLGAHQNGGRGCAGCHAPHSGGFGAGGNAITGQVQDKVNSGNYALWGQDLGPLYGASIVQGDKVDGGTTFTTTLPVQADFHLEPEELSGIMMCLSCHDGNIAQGAMMTNKSYEQATNLLPKGLYGPSAIPTLLGQDGTAAGNYYNDHPIGPQATLKAVGVSSKLQYLATGCTFHGVASPCLKDKGTDANFTAFVNHYGLPSITSTAGIMTQKFMEMVRVAPSRLISSSRRPTTRDRTRPRTRPLPRRSSAASATTVERVVRTKPAEFLRSTPFSSVICQGRNFLPWFSNCKGSG
jgi:hypothetical protein